MDCIRLTVHPQGLRQQAGERPGSPDAKGVVHLMQRLSDALRFDPCRATVHTHRELIGRRP
jgi:hypothetical protein